MSWAGDDWTVGLTGHVLQKVQQLQAQNEKLGKEKQQRQLQLDNSEAALHKQKQKYEEVRVELATVQRELGGVREVVQVEVRARERLSHDLQVKTGEVYSLEGQLESARKLTQNLTQEIKRLEAELEKQQKGNGSGESMLFSTPCWNMSSPWDNNGGFRVESESKTQHARQLQFGDVPKPSAGGASSPFPQQPHKSPPLRQHIRQSEPSTPSSLFPWEREDLWSTPKGRPASSVSSSDVIIKNSDSGMEEALRNEIDELRVSDLQREAQLESERLRDVESRLAQANREISTKEQTLMRTQDQLTRAQTRITQETDRAQASEQKVKHLQEELKCQRQNAETSRCNAEQRRKDMEREHQRELLELQRERQTQERQHQQESNRLNQEIQQARTLHNTLQAQHDKVCLQKQSLERDLEDVRGKLKNTESDLKESQKRETQTEAKLTEALRDCESLTVSLGQTKKQEKALQEEVKRLTEELALALKLIKELQAQLAAPPAVAAPHFSSAGDCFSPSVSLHHDRSPPYNHSSQRKKAPKTGRTREEETIKYPSGREPGEGIDSEHIGKFDSEESQKFKGKGIRTHPSDSLRLSETDVETTVTEQDTGIEDVDTNSFTSESTSGTMPKSESDISCSLQVDDTSGKTEKCDSAPLKDLKKENMELHDELRDLKYELQKRLEDLETQRRAESEARTKLKQLNRKHSTQTEQQRAKALELKDSVTKLEAQLEQEKKESTKLRENLHALEREAEKGLEEIERDQEEDTQLKNVLAEMERKETCMEEEMTRMKKDLQDLQLKLAQEWEEREREREEVRKRIRKEEVEVLKIVQLQEELDNLRKSQSLEEKISKDNLPVTYLQLEHHPNTDKNPAVTENKDLVASPDSQESICDSVNLQNTVVCKETRTVELIMDLGAQTKPTEDKTSVAEMGRTQTLSKGASDLDSTTVLVLEVERLRAARDQESEKAKLAQGKLEDLHKQVTTQTKHLTQAFESQSKHIENLLKELHDKDCAIQKQSEELQKCQEKICLLEEEKHTRMNIAPNEVSTPPELSTEISRELSCDSVFSNTSISDHEMFSDDTQPILKEKFSRPTVQLPVSQNTDHTNTSKITDKLQVTEAIKPHELCLASDVHCGNALNSSAVSEAPGLSEVIDENATSLLQDEQLDFLNFQNHVPQHSTGDLKELERVTKELQDAQLELNVLKAQNSELALQGGVIQEEVLTVKRENEELKLKLKHLGKDTCATQDAALLLENTGNEELSSTKEGLQSGSPIGQELTVLHANSKAEIQSLQEQIQALQEQIQHLSEQNRKQAEELELWKFSEETVGNNSPSIVLKEFELYLPCSPRKMHTQSQMTRTKMHQCTVRDVTHRSGLADMNDQTNLGEHVSLGTQMTHDVRESQGPVEDLTTGNEKVMTKEHAEHRCESSSFNYKSHKSPPVWVSDIMSSNTKDKLSPPQTKPTDYSNSDSQPIASVSPEDQTKVADASADNQKDALISVSITTKYQTEVIKSNPFTESYGTTDSQNSDVLCTEHNEIETMETLDLDKQGHCHGETTDEKNKHVEKPIKNESAQCQMVEVRKVRTEVKSVSTQTEESQELILGDKQPPVHACTQKDGDQLETVQDKGDKEPADSPPLSLIPQSVTNQLLLSSVFPMNNPAHLAERIRQSHSRMSAAYDETEYEPYGLPEVVMKGFADIPSGPACPYVLRRGLLGTDAMPLPRREATPQEEDDDIEP
ncbi:centromere protein F-like isoform X2 [Sinocyclocheilus anshuiensis]|uniref:centromere protein F-like isoform X2 n=1 Tax=Sinocyclocheilus anshuiensis TaxID=1608454 RepID=UPI0007B7B741|nr:PREDICTED: centromere protein F-like isoform X2 [Sinocyclocheilus anshuiensis]